ncbi:MAG: penicillin-binding protein 2 [Acidimicrobiia bacterium]|nr:penicillin-binding protein 2 [Acidimicrobiia bacterium]
MAVQDSQRFRLNLLGIVVLSLFAALFARLYYLQVLTEAEFQEAARTNVERVIPIQAPRGRILDTEGRVLVDNQTTLVVTVDAFVVRDQLTSPELRQDLSLRLARALSESGRLTKAADIRAELEDSKYGPFDKIPVAEGVTQEFKVWLLERQADFTGVEIQPVTVRYYPYGVAAAHVLGYIGPINESELELRASSLKAYQPFDDIGKAGVELAFEDVLRGVPGNQRLVVDARGNIVEYGEVTSPEPGNDIQLTIDIDLQVMAEQELVAGLERARLEIDSNGTGDFFNAPAGVTVILDPDGSAVLAMASYPSYDPRDFVEGISAEQFEVLVDESAGAPLNNRAIQGLYAPGSTFKPFTAYAAMNAGLISDRGALTQFSPLNDPGFFVLPGCDGGKCEFQNANRTPYGPVDLRAAITVSSDVYFYQLAWFFESFAGVRRESLQEGAEAFGFGTRTGVPLAYEADGLIPTPSLKEQRHEDFPEAFPEGRWFAGDTLNTAIGQGDMGVTPLQIANAYAVFANGGSLYSPSIAKASINPGTLQVELDYEPRLLNRLYMPAAVRDPIIDGLKGVPIDDRGTAREAFETFPNAQYPIAGKTGTSEKTGKSDFALFAAFGPADDPDYVIVTVLEEAGFGGEVAAPVVKQLFEAIALDAVPTAVPEDLDYLRQPNVLPVSSDEDPATDQQALAVDQEN